MIKIRHSTFDIRHWAVLGFVFLLGPLGSLTHAAALSWDPTATGGPNGGGIGAWDTGSWWNGTAGTAGDVSWSDGNDAVFGGTLGGGGVTILNGVAPNDVYFNIGGYSITGNMLTLGNGTIGVATGSDTIGSPIAGSSGLTKSGAGTLVLTGPGYYSGTTTISGGTLLINGADNTPSISVGLGSALGGAGSASSASATFTNSKGTLDPGYNGAGSLTVGGLNLGSPASSNAIAIYISNVNDSTSVPAIDVSGNLSITSGDAKNVTIYLSGALSGSGSIPLLYAGSGMPSTLSTAKVSFNGIPGTGTVALSVNGDYLDANYSGYTHLVWSGTGSPAGVWATGAQSSPNWLSRLSSSGGTPANFAANQQVVFDDTATGTPIVSVSGSVSPGSVTFNNNSLSYTLTEASPGSGIAGYTSLIMNGSGAVTIATSNSYTGGTTINAGRLNIANSAALGGPTTASVYGAFTINGGSVDNGVPPGPGGTLALPNYPIAWNAGFVFPGSNPLNLGAGAVTLGNSAAVTLSGSTLTLGGPIGDNGLGYGFTQNGAGVLALGGSSTYSGETTVNGGTLTLGNGASINGTSGVNLAAANSVLVFSHTDSQIFIPTIGGSGGVVQTGSGMVTLATSNTYAGGTAITGGTLALGDPLALQNSTLNLGSSGILSFGSLTAGTLGGLAGQGTLALANSAAAAVTLSAGNNNANTTYSGTLTGPGGLTKIGTGTLWLSGSNNFAGTTNVNGGSLVVANAAALQNSTVNVAANTNIAFSVSAASVGGLSGTGNLSLGSAVLTVGANNTNSNFPGSLSGGNGVTKAGSGTLAMTGTNTYSGPTIINAGTVRLSNGIVGFGAITSGSAGQSNGTWQFNNSGNTAAIVTGGSLNLTGNVGNEARSGFYMMSVPMGAFGATFLYQSGGSKAADGATFMLQSDPRGTAALGSDGGGLGYNGINNSAGIGMNIYASASGGAGVYLLENGGVQQTTSPPDHTFFGSGDPIQVNVSYDGSSYLSSTFLDLSTGTSYSTSYYIGSLASITGGSTAYVGLSGGDGGSKSTQTISNFSFGYNAGAYTNVLPVATALSVAAGATLDLSGNSQTIGSLAGAGTVTNDSPDSLSVLTAGGDNSSQTFSGALSDGYGTLGLIKVGAGSLALTSSNIYSGGTTISGGTLQLGNGTTKNGSVAGGILDNSALVFANPAAQLYTGLISGSGTLIKNASGALQLSATHVYTGPTVINAGTIQLGYTVNVSGFGANTTGGFGNGTASSGTAAGVGTLTNGTWTITSSTYGFGFIKTPVTNSVLDLTDGTGGGGGGFGSANSRAAFYNTKVPVNDSFTATFTYTPTSFGNSNENFANGFAFVLQNDGRGLNAWAGAGRGLGVGLDPQGNFPAGATAIDNSMEIDYDVFAGGPNFGNPAGAATGYDTNGGVATPNTIFSGSASNGTGYAPDDPIKMTVSYNALTDVLSWSGTDAAKSLTFSKSQAGVDLQSITGGTSAYLGFTGADGLLQTAQTVANFSFSSAVNGYLPSTTALSISKSGTLDLFGGNQTVGDLSGAGTVTNSFPMPVTLTTGGDGSSQTFSGRIQDGAGGIALTVVGGALTLSGTNTYSLGTNVEGGTLIATNPAAIEDGTSLIVGNGTAFAPLTPAAMGVGGADLPGTNAEQSAAVPEPAAAAMAAAGAVLLAVYRAHRRRHSNRSARTSSRRN